MSNKKPGDITPELLELIASVLQDLSNHEYSVSKIYKAHNHVFKLTETPESCSSCLRKRAKALEAWYEEYLKSGEKKEDTPKEVNKESDEKDPIALTDKAGNEVEAFLKEGNLVNTEGKALKVGTYTTSDGDVYRVQPGGKTTLKEDLL